MTARIAAADVDPLALGQPPVARRPLRRRTLAFVLTGVVAYLLGLIALIPARAVMAESDRVRVGGTIWRGEAVIASTVHVEWTFAPLTTLTHLAYSADWRLTGGATDLAGSATRGGGVLRLEGVSGQADGTLLAVAAPRLPIACNFLADVAIDRIVIGGAAQQALGTLRTSPVKCVASAAVGAPLDLPALRGEITPNATGSGGALATAMRGEDLIEVRLSRNGALSIWPTARATRLAPFLSGQRYDTLIK